MRLGERLSPRTGDALAWDAHGRSLPRARAEALGPAPDLEGDVALSVADPLDLLRLLLALDGRLGSMLLLSHALSAEAAAALAGSRALVTDRADLLGRPGARPPAEALAEGGPAPDAAARETRWLLTTSGTTGLPKVVPHTLATLSRSVSRLESGPPPTWGLLYDPTRFAGLQVVLQALVGGGALALADTAQPLPAQVAQLAEAGVTALSATPTLWRRLLMAPGAARLPLRQATLGGEVADQATLDALRLAFPGARVTHIYASTEAGVGFSVRDGRAGFPAGFLDAAAPGGVRLSLRDGILWVRPPLPSPAEGRSAAVEVDAEGFVRTGDRVRVEGDRALFLGRDSGAVNVGGVKVHPERVEAVIGAVPGVALAQVRGRPSALTGALLVAEVQLRDGADPDAVRAAILAACRAALEREAVPASVRFVEGLRTNAAGKLVRMEAP